MWLLAGCGSWITPAEQDARLAELGYVDTDGDGHPDVPDDTDELGDPGPHTWDDADIVVEKVKRGLESSGGGMNVDITRSANGTMSRMVYCEAPGVGGEGEVNRIDDDEIAYAYDQSEPYETPVRGGRYPNGVPALLPWAPEWTAPSDRVSYNLEVVTEAAFDCWAMERFGVDPETGTLRLRVVLASDEWDEDDLASNHYDGAMQRVDEAFERVGITLERTLEATDSDCRNTEPDSYDALARVVECEVTPGERELVLYLPETIEGSLIEPGDHATLGLAPGVPFLANGTLGAAFVPLSSLREGGESAFGRDVAHAIGHYLGLWELWEYAQNEGDPLSDTPRCGAAVGEDSTSCGSGASDNVMFPAPGPTTGFVFTDDQGWVMRRSLLVR